jgi:hypothetical protein
MHESDVQINDLWPPEWYNDLMNQACDRDTFTKCIGNWIIARLDNMGNEINAINV